MFLRRIILQWRMLLTCWVCTSTHWWQGNVSSPSFHQSLIAKLMFICSSSAAWMTRFLLSLSPGTLMSLITCTHIIMFFTRIDQSLFYMELPSFPKITPIIIIIVLCAKHWDGATKYPTTLLAEWDLQQIVVTREESKYIMTLFMPRQRGN